MTDIEKARAWVITSQWGGEWNAGQMEWLVETLADYGAHCAHCAREAEQERDAHLRFRLEQLDLAHQLQGTLEAERDALAAQVAELRAALNKLPALVAHWDDTADGSCVAECPACIVADPLGQPTAPRVQLVAAALALAEATDLRWNGTFDYEHFKSLVLRHRAAKEAAK